MRKERWFIYTVGVGFIPIFVRIFLYFFDKKCTCDLIINENDFLTFALILSLANINELEGIDIKNKKWKFGNMGGALLNIIFISIIWGWITYATINKDENFNYIGVKIFSIIWVAGSLYWSLGIYNNLKKNGYE